MYERELLNTLEEKKRGSMFPLQKYRFIHSINT